MKYGQGTFDIKGPDNPRALKDRLCPIGEKDKAKIQNTSRRDVFEFGVNVAQLRRTGEEKRKTFPNSL